MQKKNRFFGLDILRTLAIVSVVGGHFFLNTKFASATFNTPSMLFQGCVQYFFTSLGVPLFLMLTGYLNCHKKLEWSYYPRIGRVLADYFVISLITYFVLERENGYSVVALIKGIFSYHTINYAWYIEMYIGLFLLIPFLNLLWKGMMQSRAEQSRAEQSRAEQSRAEQSRAEQRSPSSLPDWNFDTAQLCA